MALSRHALLTNLLLAVAIAGGSPCAGAAQPGQKEKPVYKWVDEKGVVHYGDSVPAQYSKQERRILNDQGVEIGRLEAERSEAQRVEDEIRRQALASARQRDQILLTTYVSAEQIEQLRDQRLDLIDGQLKVSRQYLDTLHKRLEVLQSQAQFYSPYSSNSGAQAMPDQLAEDLVRTLNEIRMQERVLTSKNKEQTELRAQFQSDLERYRELKASRK
jgi:hypothetical protein